MGSDAALWRLPPCSSAGGLHPAHHISAFCSTCVVQPLRGASSASGFRAMRTATLRPRIFGLSFACWTLAASSRPLRSQCSAAVTPSDGIALRRSPGPAPPGGYWEAELQAKKSRFIARLSACSTLDEAREFRRLVADEKASHNVWAAVARDGTAACSDDGEPAGTSGMPMRLVLEKSGLLGTVVVVTRYFGGTLLGTGGLVRAYSAACKAVVDVADFTEVQLCTSLLVQGVPGARLSAFYSILSAPSVELIGEVAFDGTGSATAKLQVPKQLLTSVRAHCEALCRDKVKVSIIPPD